MASSGWSSRSVEGECRPSSRRKCADANEAVLREFPFRSSRAASGLRRSSSTKRNRAQLDHPFVLRFLPLAANKRRPYSRRNTWPQRPWLTVEHEAFPRRFRGSADREPDMRRHPTCSPAPVRPFRRQAGQCDVVPRHNHPSHRLWACPRRGDKAIHVRRPRTCDRLIGLRRPGEIRRKRGRKSVDTTASARCSMEC